MKGQALVACLLAALLVQVHPKAVGRLRTRWAARGGSSGSRASKNRRSLANDCRFNVVKTEQRDAQAPSTPHARRQVGLLAPVTDSMQASRARTPLLGIR
jgi:hypothetical protein